MATTAVNPNVMGPSSSSSSSTPASSSSAPELPDPLVSVDWLSQHLHHPLVRVVDGSWYMPAMGRDAQKEYASQRIPGAVFFDLDACCDKQGRNASLPHMLPSPEQFASYMNALGIHREHRVVFYDGMGCFSAPRVRLTFKHFGMEHVAMLDGGFPAWKAARKEVEGGEGGEDQGGASTSQPEASSKPSEQPSKSFDPQPPPNSSFVYSMDAIRSNLPSSSSSSPSSFLLIDARSQGRFEGSEPEPRPGLPSGHIPGSINVPFTECLEKDEKSGVTRLKSPAALKTTFRQHGVDPSTSLPIVASCGSGVTASVLLLALERMGRESNVGLYDGSWTEWATEGNPMAKGK